MSQKSSSLSTVLWVPLLVIFNNIFFKTLECFPSALFPKLWNSIELELKETKSAKPLKRKVAKNYLDSYASYIYKKNCVSCGLT